MQTAAVSDRTQETASGNRCLDQHLNVRYPLRPRVTRAEPFILSIKVNDDDDL